MNRDCVLNNIKELLPIALGMTMVLQLFLKPLSQTYILKYEMIKYVGHFKIFQ